MKQLAIVTFILSVCATSVHAEAQSPNIQRRLFQQRL